LAELSARSGQIGSLLLLACSIFGLNNLRQKNYMLAVP